MPLLLPRQVMLPSSTQLIDSIAESVLGPGHQGSSRSGGTAGSTISQLIQTLTSAKGQNDINKFIKNLIRLTNLCRQRKQDRQAITASITPIITEISPSVAKEHLGAWLWCLGGLGYHINTPEHSALLQSAVVPFIQQIEQQQMPIFNLRRGLAGLAWSGHTLNHFTNEQQITLFNTLAMHMDGVDLSDLCQQLQSLRKLGARYSTLPQDLITALWKAVTKHAMTPLEPLSTCLLVGNLGGLGWVLTDEQQQLMLKVASKGLTMRSDDESAKYSAKWNMMVVRGLAELGFRHAVLPEELKSKIDTCLLDTLSWMTPLSVYHLLTSFDTMGLPWKEFKPELLSAVISAAKRSKHNMTEDEVNYLNQVAEYVIPRLPTTK